MLKNVSHRQNKLSVGVKSYTELRTVLDVTGKVGIATTNAAITLDVNGGVGAGIFAWSNVIKNNIDITSSHRTALIYVDRDLTVDIEPGFTVTIDDGCYLNIIDL